MKFEIVKISEVRSNPNNPRFIKDEKFDKLVESIKSFPQMLELRPIVVNDKMVVLGGTMRLKACVSAGLKEIPIIKASNLTEEQQKEFIIKDNVGFGEWDWDALANDWEALDLEMWGLDLPIDSKDLDFEREPIEDPTMKITFKNPEDLQKAETQIIELLDREFDGSTYSIQI